MQAQILQHQQQQAQQRQQQEQQLQWDAQHLLLRTEQERQQRHKAAVAAHLQLQRAATSWVRTAEPSAEVAGLTSKLLVDLQHQQNYDQQQQQQQAEQQHQISAGVEAAIATAPPAATREIQYATKLLQNWYPAMQLDEAAWNDLPEFLAQPALLLYQAQAT